MPFNRRISLPLVLFFAFCIPAQAAELGDLRSSFVQEDGLELQTHDGALLRLSFLAPDVLRIQAGADGELSDEGSGKAEIVLGDAFAGVSVKPEVTERDSRLELSTSAMTLVVEREPLRLELRRADGRVLWRELKPLELSEHGTIQTLSSHKDERFFGGGQQNGTFQFKGRLMEISYSGGWEEGDRPSPAPFYMSDRGYGILRNTWKDGVYDFRSDGYLTTRHDEHRFDAYVMVGDSIHEVLDLYTRLTGRAGLLPRWAFGYGDADCYNDGDNVKKPGTVPEGWSDGPTGTTPDVIALAEAYREHDMPGSWILPNDGYGCGYTDLPEVVKRLGELGFRTGLWTEDGVEKIAWEVGTAGTRVQKLDVAWTGKGYQWALDANHDAATGILENSDSRPVLWTVMGWADMQRYAVTWTGDQSGGWDFIRWHIPTLIGSGLSGMNYSTGDVDGIFGGTPELYTRDLQWKSFTPVLMGMSGWSKAERKHPWWFDEPHRSIHRRYLKLRQRLMPYIYTLARETELTGAPMVRSIRWDHPRDPHADGYPYQFLFGRDFLVAPVYRSQAASGGWREDIYLPEGRWIDYWTGTVIEAGTGGKVVDRPVDLATLPIWVRAGAIVPMVPESLYDGQVLPNPLTLDIYPHGESDYVLYEDDGKTRQYKDGAFSTQGFRVSADDGTLTVELAAAEGDYEGMLHERGIVLELHVPSAPLSVTLDGNDLPASEQGPGWAFDAQDRGGLLRIRAGRLSVRAAHRVTVEPGPGPAPIGGYEPMPAGDGTVPVDGIHVVSRPSEEPGHPVENAFDGNPDTWFRTVRDQSASFGPHELTLALGGRRMVEGLRLAPRNDKHWKYGQVRDYEIYMGDVNGLWGDPVATGALERVESEQEIRFPARAGRLLRLRVLSTHDDELDPMVLGAAARGDDAYDATAPVRVGSITLSELRLLEQQTPSRPRTTVTLDDDQAVRLNGLDFEHGLRFEGEMRRDFQLEGRWLQLKAEAGRDDRGPRQGSLRLQVWGDDHLLWDSGVLTGSDVVKPRVDIRGISRLSLRSFSDPAVEVAWTGVELEGFESAAVQEVTDAVP